jgi:leucyl/phenylalanyl-tRNA--protein transferase
MTEEVTSELLLAAYANGYFPMAESRESEELHWFYPEKRGIIPLESFHMPKSLAKLSRKHPFAVTTDKAFPEVVAACSERKETWINDAIIRLYCELWEKGYGHSVECWLKSPSGDGSALSPVPCEGQETRSGGNILVGGLYGIALGGAFFGESMFSRVPNASKMALVTLVQLLKEAGYTLLDTQYTNDHLKQFGVIEVPRKDYLKRLKDALKITPLPCF